MMTLYKYHGAGNDFLIGDNRHGELLLDNARIIELCDRHYGLGADGLILLENSTTADFKMVFYNPDATRGMMCGNGGRCIISFARRLGYQSFHFEAADGLHGGHVLSESEIRENGLHIPYDPSDPNREIVKLEMRDVDQLDFHPELQRKINLECFHDPVFLNTGSRHLVIHTQNVAEVDLESIAPALRYDETFRPHGTNVNFIEIEDENSLFIRSYEKGVEGETYACGTGAIASAIAFRQYQYRDAANTAMTARVNASASTSEALDTTASGIKPGSHLTTHIRTLKEHLAVEFRLTENGAKDIRIIGPSTLVAEIHIA